MSSERTNKKLEELTDGTVITYGVVKPGDTKVGGIKFIRGGDISNGKILVNQLRTIDAEISSTYKRTILKGGELLVSLVGNPGEVAIVDDTLIGANIARQVGLIRIDPKKANAKFVEYFLRSISGRSSIKAMCKGSVQQVVNLADLKNIIIPLPSLDTQAYVADFFTKIDTRIDLLKQTNQTLEAIAQTLFKSWFVNFDLVHAKQQGIACAGIDAETADLFPNSFEDSELGLIPKGWNVTNIGNVVDAVGGGTPDTKNNDYWSPAIHSWTSPKDMSSLSSPILLKTERKISDSGLKKISSGLLAEGTLLLSSRAPIGYMALNAMPVAINQGYIAITDKGILPPLFMYFWCKQNMDLIKGAANGSTFMEISKTVFRQLKMIRPQENLIVSFTSIASNIFSAITNNEYQIQTLAQVRDTLLPRLISGKLDVSAIEAQLEEMA